jgi:hypothetical protein
LEEYITPSELILLLAILWLPVFAFAATIQWRLLSAHSKLIAWLVGSMLMEIALAFAIWLSPIHHYFLCLNSLGEDAIGSLPLQSAILASVIVTSLIWAVSRHG